MLSTWFLQVGLDCDGSLTAHAQKVLSCHKLPWHIYHGTQYNHISAHGSHQPTSFIGNNLVPDF